MKVYALILYKNNIQHEEYVDVQVDALISVNPL